MKKLIFILLVIAGSFLVLHGQDVDVRGNIELTGTVDGIDIAAQDATHNTMLQDSAVVVQRDSALTGEGSFATQYDLSQSAGADAVARAMLQDSLGNYYVNHPGDSTRADVEIQAAIDAAHAAGGGKVIIKDGKYIINTTLTMYSYVIVEGQSQECKLYGNTLMFHLPSSSTRKWELRNLNIRQMSGSCIQIDSSSVDVNIEKCVFNKQDDDDPIMISGDEISDILELRIYDCEFDMNASSTTPFIYFRSTGSFNHNVIEQCRFQADYADGCPMIVIEDGTNSYAYNNHFKDLNFETCLGGAIHMYSAQGTIIENCIVYDVTGQTVDDDLFKFDRTDAGSANSINNLIINSGRVGGTTMNTGIYDINLTANATYTTLINCYAQGTPTLSLRSWSGSNTIYGGKVSVDNGVVGTVIDGVAGNQFSKGIVHVPTSSATATEGRIFYDSDDNHFYGYNGSSWVQLDN